MLHRWLTCLILICCSLSSTAATVAFFEQRDGRGRLRQIEPDGHFYHVAIRLGPKLWAHSDPRGGVMVVDSILPFGRAIAMLENPAVPDPTLPQVAPLIGLPFDPTFTWGRTDSTYCSRFVAELLNIPPQPLEHGNPGELGLSPDDLYRALLKLGFTPVRRCVRLLQE